MSPRGSDNEQSFVLFSRFRDSPDALVAKTILDSADVECLLGDENTIRMDWLWSNAIGGVKLWLHEGDTHEATALLDQEPLGEFEVEGFGKYSQPRCPACGSFDVSFDGLNRPVAYGSLLVCVPIPLKRSGWRCDACGHKWPEPAIESHPNEP